MDLEPFATIDEVRFWLQEPEMGDDEARRLAELASDSVRAEVGQLINRITDDEIALDGTGGQVVLLPELEVVEVASVSIGGRQLLDDWEYTWQSNGVLTRRGWTWPSRPGWIQVVYSHGWAVGSPQWSAARQVTLEIAARMRRNPEMLQSERIGDWSRTFVPTAGRAALTPIEARSLDILRPGP